MQDLPDYVKENPNSWELRARCQWCKLSGDEMIRLVEADDLQHIITFLEHNPIDTYDEVGSAYIGLSSVASACSSSSTDLLQDDSNIASYKQMLITQLPCAGLARCQGSLINEGRRLARQFVQT